VGGQGPLASGFPRIGARHCTASSASTSARCGGSWPGSASARWRRATSSSTTCTCSCPFPEVRRGAGHRVHQGEERHPHRAHRPRPATQRHGPALLGPGRLRLPRRDAMRPRSGRSIQKREAEDQRLDHLNIFARERHLQVAVGFPTAWSGSQPSSHRLCPWCMACWGQET
jgi:hypothetical protein